MAATPMTVNDIVATLQKTSLPTALVEGTSDMAIYRWIESRADIATVNILPCGGRTALLEVFRRRKEFSGAKTVFVADRDMWYFTGIPPGHESIVWTTGYSIENDVYEPSALEDLMDAAERTEFSEVLKECVRWYSFEVEEFRAGRSTAVATHPNQVVLPGTRSLSPAFCTTRGFREPNSSTVAEVHSQYRRSVRGKTLLQLLVRFLSRSGRDAKFSNQALVHAALAMTPVNDRLDALLASIRTSLA
jgi:hypothetical protein